MLLLYKNISIFADFLKCNLRSVGKGNYKLCNKLSNNRLQTLKSNTSIAMQSTKYVGGHQKCSEMRKQIKKIT